MERGFLMAMTVTESTSVPRDLAPGNNWLYATLTFSTAGYTATGEACDFATASDVDYVYEMRGPAATTTGYVPMFVAATGSTSSACKIKLWTTDTAGVLVAAGSGTDLHATSFSAWFRVL